MNMNENILNVQPMVMNPNSNPNSNPNKAQLQNQYLNNPMEGQYMNPGVQQ